MKNNNDDPDWSPGSEKAKLKAKCRYRACSIPINAAWRSSISAKLNECNINGFLDTFGLSNAEVRKSNT